MKHENVMTMITRLVMLGMGVLSAAGVCDVFGAGQRIAFLCDGKEQEQKYLWQDDSRVFVLQGYARPTRNLDGKGRYAIYCFDVSGATGGELSVHLLNSVRISLGPDGQTFTEVFREAGKGGANEGWKTIALDDVLPSAFRYLYVKVEHGAEEDYHGGFGACLFEVRLRLDGIADVPLAGAVMVDEEMVIDGRLDEGVWERGQELCTFSDRFMARLPERGTVYRLAYDEDTLYLAGECEQPGADTAMVTAREHDSAVYSDDCLEMFIQGPGQEDYYHLAVNALGVTFDERGGGGAGSWNPAVRVGARRSSEGWCVEVAVPREDLGAGVLEAGQVWRMGLYRCIMEYAQMVAWSSVQGRGWHVPERFGEVVLLGATGDDVPFINLVAEGEVTYGVNAIQVAYEHLDEQKEYAVQLTMLPVESYKLSKDMQDLEQMNPVTTVLGCSGSGDGVIGATYQVDRFGGFHLVGALLEGGEKRVVSRAVLGLAVTAEDVKPIEITLQQPYVSTEEAIKVEVAINLAEENCAGRRLRAMLMSAAGEAVQVFAERELAGMSGEALTYSLAVGGIDYGDYRFGCEVVDRGDEMVLHVEKTLEKFYTELRPHSIWVGEGMRIMVDGEAMMPMGFMLGGAGADDLAAGYNIGLWGCESQPIESRCGLDKAQANGTMAMLHICNYLRGRNDYDGIRARVSRLKNEPGLFAWYLGDEPEAYGDTPDVLRRAYDIIKQIDPCHPVYVVTNAPGMLGHYQGCADIIGTDPYPIDSHPLDLVANWTDATVRAAGANGQSVLMVPQGFGFKDIGGNGRAPTNDEFTTMLMTCFVHGSKGITWWPYDTPRRKYWDHFKVMGSYSRYIEPWVLFGEGDGAQVVGGVHYRVWEHEGKVLVVGVNLEKEREDVVVKVPRGGKVMEMVKPFAGLADAVYDAASGELRFGLDYAQCVVYVLE